MIFEETAWKCHAACPIIPASYTDTAQGYPAINKELQAAMVTG